MLVFSDVACSATRTGSAKLQAGREALLELGAVLGLHNALGVLAHVRVLAVASMGRAGRLGKEHDILAAGCNLLLQQQCLQMFWSCRGCGGA